MPKVVAKPHTAEWYAARNTGIGASEIAIAAGLSPYATPLELYHRKRGELPPLDETDSMRLGLLLEPVVKAEFTTRTGIAFSDPSPPMYRHDNYGMILATPDGIIDNSEVFEAKTASWRMKQLWGDESTDTVPDAYLCQCQMQLAVMGFQFCHLAVLFDAHEFRTYRIARNDELIDMLMRAGIELWQRIQEGRPPEPNWEHPSTPSLISAIHDTVAETRIELSYEEAFLWREYESLGREITELKKRRKAAKAKVLHAIGDHGAGLLGDGRMVRRKLILGGPVSYERDDYIDVRAVKADAAGEVRNLETVA